MDNNNDFDGGESVPLGFGNTLVFYPISFGVQRKKLSEQWGKVFGNKVPGGSDEWVDAVVDIFFYSANRPYNVVADPGNAKYSRDAIADMIDHRNVASCFRALGVASGFRNREESPRPIEPVPEGTAARPTSPQNGGNSTPKSSQPPDGPSSSATN